MLLFCAYRWHHVDPVDHKIAYCLHMMCDIAITCYSLGSYSNN